MTRRLLISGRVQGVGFRYFLRREAEKRGVTGWARNRPDGRVEAVVQGDDAAVEAVIAWARQGPRDAAVSDLAIEPADGRYYRFEILVTT